MSILIWSVYVIAMVWVVIRKKLKPSQALLPAFAFASIASVALGQNYTMSQIPEANDGIGVSNFLAKFLLPDEGWTVELFYTQFQLYLVLSLVLILLYLIAVLSEKKSIQS